MSGQTAICFIKLQNSYAMPLQGYVYCMTNDRYPGYYKIGYTSLENAQVRRAFVDRSMKGKVSVLFSQKLFLAYPWEKFLHYLFGHIRTTTHGSGKTEWFRPAFSPFLPLCWGLVYWSWPEDVLGIAQAIYPSVTHGLLLPVGVAASIVAQAFMFPALIYLIVVLLRALEIAFVVLVFLSIIYFFDKMPIHLGR